MTNRKEANVKVAILSDIHDNVWNLRAVLGALADAEAMVCCGDLCAPFMLARLAEGFGGRPIHIVFGNNDGDLYRITQVAAGFDTVRLHGELFTGELGGRRFVATHYDSVAATIDPSGADVICYGHNHRFAVERRGESWFVNPGAVMGYTPLGDREVAVSFALYDSDTHRVEGFEIGVGNRCRDRAAPFSG